MPAPPELGDGARDIGVVEVPRKLKAQHPAQAHGHVGVAGEIEVDLQGEGDHAQPGARRGELRGGQSLVGVPELPQIVGQQYFLAQTYREGLYAGGKPLHRVVPVVDLISQLLILDDRPGDELGEQGDEGAEIDEIPLDRCVTPVDVDGIGHGLEGVERDADGQAQAQNGHEGQPNGGQAPGDKVPVLEKEKQRQVEYHRGAHRQPGAPVVASALAPPQYSVGVVDDGGEEHDDDIDRLSPSIKNEVEDQQHPVPPAQGRHIVDQQYNRQIEKQKQEAGKNQALHLIS